MFFCFLFQVPRRMAPVFLLVFSETTRQRVSLKKNNNIAARTKRNTSLTRPELVDMALSPACFFPNARGSLAGNQVAAAPKHGSGFGYGSKFKHQELDRRCWSMFPFTRIPFWGYPIFDNHSHLTAPTVLDGSRCKAKEGTSAEAGRQCSP